MSDAPTPSKKRRNVLLAIAVLIGALILLIAAEWGSIVGSKSVPEPAEPQKSGAVSPSKAPAVAVVVIPQDKGPAPVRAFGMLPEAPAEPVPGSHAEFAIALNDPAHDVRHDLGIVAEFFAHYLGEFRELPVGNNAEITAALVGDNARAFAILSPAHRAINADGDLTDRWGTPYFFHQLASDLMEIRSSGPDRRRYTADDAVWPAANPNAGDKSTTIASR